MGAGWWQRVDAAAAAARAPPRYTPPRWGWDAVCRPNVCTLFNPGSLERWGGRGREGERKPHCLLVLLKGTDVFLIDTQCWRLIEKDMSVCCDYYEEEEEGCVWQTML